MIYLVKRNPRVEFSFSTSARSTELLLRALNKRKVIIVLFYVIPVIDFSPERMGYMSLSNLFFLIFYLYIYFFGGEVKLTNLHPTTKS